MAFEGAAIDWARVAGDSYAAEPRATSPEFDTGWAYGAVNAERAQELLG